MMRLSIAAALIAWAFFPSRAIACTTVVGVGEHTVLVANNLDTAPPPRIWFIPGEGGLYGRMCFGTDAEFRIAEGGVNERGLFIAVNAVDPTGWAADLELPPWEEWSGWYGTGVPDGILANCATVDEAVAVFRGYSLLTLAHVKFLLADRSGASAIVEWSDGRLRVIGHAGPGHQISTNTLTSALNAGQARCERHAIAERILARHHGEPTPDLMRGILSATHLEGWTPTIYSAVYDLVRGRIELYYFHNFEEAVSLDLTEQLSKGKSRHALADLFAVLPFIRTVYE